MLKTKHLFALAAIFTSIIFVSCGDGKPGGTDKDPDSIPKVEPFKAIAPEFSADTAYRFIEQQLAFGPRIPNTPAHVACAEWMVNQFKAYGAETMVQAAEIKDRSGKLIQMKNIIASYNPAATKRVMLTAHWDSRPFADKDGKNPSAPVPGANDGASGVAVILEVARQFHIKAPTVGVDLILWDAEDNGSYNDNESWCQGSQYWVNHPHKAGYRAAWGINLDMVGAKDARFTKDAYSLQSARGQTDHVWSIAAQLGYGNYFSGAYTDFASIDDHYFIIEGTGTPMVEVIDRDLTSSEFFPHWHTTTDDINAIDKATLKATGQVMLEVLYREKISVSKERKYYVVWVGKNPGVYDAWPAAQSQVAGHPDARFKSFVSLEEAKLAFQRPWQDFVKPAGPGGGPGKPKSEPKILTEEFLKEIVADSISVDAACSGNPGKMEYRGVYTLAPEIEIFRSQVFPLGTNNIGEFLALVHALAMFHETKPELTIYSDSKLAQGWIKKKKCATKLPVNKKTEYLHSIIARAETWLKTHKFKNKILKWETKKWGEIPADFGRK